MEISEDTIINIPGPFGAMREVDVWRVPCVNAFCDNSLILVKNPLSITPSVKYALREQLKNDTLKIPDEGLYDFTDVISFLMDEDIGDWCIDFMNDTYKVWCPQHS